MTSVDRREAAYWLALAFHLERARVLDKNSLVLQAMHDAELSLLDLVTLDTEELPKSLENWATIHARLLEAEGRVSAQAFVVDRMAQAGYELIPLTHPTYPRHLLQQLTPRKAPTLLSVAGDVTMLHEPGVAISGSRKAGPSGLHFARAVGRALAEAGLTVISGLARGVDTEALEGALEAGGQVIGVSPEGIFQTRATRRREVDDGRLTIISEFEPTARWVGWAAMRRNTTIAGMSRALFIADCVAEGGTTAQFDVHRDHGLPVYIRRGPGEGRLMAELAARPGAYPLQWERGGVTLPRSLSQATGPQQGLRCSVWREGGRLLVTVDAPESTTAEAVVAAVGAQLAGHIAEREESTRYTPRIRPLAAHDAPPAPSPGNETVEDPILRALTAMSKQRGTVAELSKQVGWSAKKTRSKLRSLEEAGEVEVDRSGRSHVFALASAATSPRPKQTQLSQLELLSG